MAENLAAWIKAGGKCEWHGWAKRGPRGRRKVWTLRRVDHDGRDIP